jgi:signal transduction histidine kinase
MRKNSINYKVFLLVAAFFILFTTITMSMQSLFIEKFYRNWKTNDFKKNFINMKSIMETNNYDLQAVEGDISKHETENNMQLAIMSISDKSALFKFVPPMNDTLQSPQRQSISLIGNENVNALSSALEKLKGDPKLLKALTVDHETIYFETKPNGSDIYSIVGMTPNVESPSMTTILIATSSLQPIGEAAAVIKEFYVYFYIIALFLILILSYILSNMIAKPLLNLNGVAQKMADFNFLIKYNVKSNDEIGSLGKTLNFLSEKLGNALSELQQANIKLKEDIKNEKKLEKMRREFVAGISHELKTPISIINGYAEALKDDVLEDDKDTLLDIIMEESEKMTVLLNDMLDLSVLESGTYELNLEEASIVDILDDLYSTFSAHIKNKDIHFIKNIAVNNPIIRCDIFRIEQVLTNLLTNAIRHTLKGSYIYLNACECSEGIMLEMINEGDELPEDELPSIWEKFYRVDKSRNRSSGGTGIGLSIVKDILELHGFNYGVNNTETGVRFWFIIVTSF